MTFSIVALDPASGWFGAATQTRHLAVGASVPWVRAGVGAVVTQAHTERRHGPWVLDELERGATAPEALDAALARDAEPDRRQVAVIDASGRGAVHTGRRCIPAAGGLVGEGWVVVANLVAGSVVWEAMGDAFAASAFAASAFAASVQEPLGSRLLGALVAGEAAGGDRRGRQSAALLVERAAADGEGSGPERIDLRVDDHRDPLAELTRLAILDERRRRRLERQAAILAGSDPTDDDGDHDTEPEAAVWEAVAWAERGDHERAARLVARAAAHDVRWRALFEDATRRG